MGCRGHLDQWGLKVPTWHSQLAATVTVVAQEPFLFSGTIAENIRMGGRRRATPRWCGGSGRRVDSSCDGLPQQPTGDVGEAGARLSGGQAARLDRRTLLADTPVVVLDEATAYADPDNEWGSACPRRRGRAR